MYLTVIYYPALFAGIFFSILGGFASVHSLIKIAKGDVEESKEGKPGTKMSLLIFFTVLLFGIIFILFGLYGEEWGFKPKRFR